MDEFMVKMKEYKDLKEQYKNNETILARIVKSEEAYIKRMKGELPRMSTTAPFKGKVEAPFKGKVEVIRTGYCTDCEFFRPELSSLFGDGQLVETHLRCELEKICGRMYQILKASKVPAPLDPFAE